MCPNRLTQFISSGPFIEEPFTQLNDPIIAELEANSTPSSASRFNKIKGAELEENEMKNEADTEDIVDIEKVELSDKCPNFPESHLPCGKLSFPRT